MRCLAIYSSISAVGLRAAAARPPRVPAWRVPVASLLCLYLGDRAGPHRVAALADGEALAGLQSDGRDQLDVHVDVVAGHHHLRAAGQADRPGDVGGAQVELRPVAVVEGRMAATLLLG